MKWLPALVFAAPTIWTFEKDDLDKAPAGFEFAVTKKTPSGQWLVKRDGDNKVLAQLNQDKTGNRFAMALAKDSSFKDLELSVRGKPVSGEGDQAVGLAWRVKDENNYYVARANALEDNVRLYRVVDGKRIQFAGKDDVKVKSGEWHALKVRHKGAKIEVIFNGEKLFEAEDKTFPDAGKIGVWIKADSVTYFDDLAVEELK